MLPSTALSEENPQAENAIESDADKIARQQAADVICPVSFQIYLHPVKLFFQGSPNEAKRYGKTFEQEIVEKLRSRSCPITREAFTGHEPDNEKLQQVAAYLIEHPDEQADQYVNSQGFSIPLKSIAFAIAFALSLLLGVESAVALIFLIEQTMPHNTPIILFVVINCVIVHCLAPMLAGICYKALETFTHAVNHIYGHSTQSLTQAQASFFAERLRDRAPIADPSQQALLAPAPEEAEESGVELVNRGYENV